MNIHNYGVVVIYLLVLVSSINEYYIFGSHNNTDDSNPCGFYFYIANASSYC